MGEPEYLRRQRDDALARQREEAEHLRRKQQESEERYRRKLEDHAREVQRRDDERMRQAKNARERAGTNGCFVGETRIATPRGTRPIAELRAGDEVLSRTKEGRVETVKIRRHIVRPAAEIRAIHLAASAEPVRVTCRHPLLTSVGWVQASRLVPGDRLTGLDGVARLVIEVTRERHVSPVFNIHVEGEGSYVADGCVAHSFGRLRELRVWWMKVTARVASRRPVAAHANDR